MVSDASRASIAADFNISRRAASASVTASLARLILAPSVLRSSGDILPSVANRAEIEPCLPSAATRTASRAASSLAAAIWPRMVCSSVARLVTDQSLLPKGRWLWPRQGRKVKQKAANSGTDDWARLNPFRWALNQGKFDQGACDVSKTPSGRLGCCLVSGRPIGASGGLPGQIDPFRGYRCCAEQGSQLRKGDADIGGLPV